MRASPAMASGSASSAAKAASGSPAGDRSRECSLANASRNACAGNLGQSRVISGNLG